MGVTSHKEKAIEVTAAWTKTELCAETSMEAPARLSEGRVMSKKVSTVIGIYRHTVPFLKQNLTQKKTVAAHRMEFICRRSAVELNLYGSWNATKVGERGGEKSRQLKILKIFLCFLISFPPELKHHKITPLQCTLF